MSSLLPDGIPKEHLENAEHVRSYLISLRGGAPFLSGADGRLLVQWLDDQIPVPVILSALDRVSLRRRAKRVRTRLSLNVCKGELKKMIGKKSSQRKKNTNEEEISGLEALAMKIMLGDFPIELNQASQQLSQRLLLLAQSDDDIP